MCFIVEYVQKFDVKWRDLPDRRSKPNESMCHARSLAWELQLSAWSSEIFPVVDMSFSLASAFSLILLPELMSALNCSSNAGASGYEPFPKNGYYPLFSTRMEIRLTSFTYFVEEWFDAEDEKGTVSMRSDDRTFRGVYYDKKSKEVDRVLGNNCSSFEW